MLREEQLAAAEGGEKPQKPFDKDCPMSVDFVCAATSLRATIYGIQVSSPRRAVSPEFLRWFLLLILQYL